MDMLQGLSIYCALQYMHVYIIHTYIYAKTLNLGRDPCKACLLQLLRHVSEYLQAWRWLEAGERVHAQRKKIRKNHSSFFRSRLFRAQGLVKPKTSASLTALATHRFLMCAYDIISFCRNALQAFADSFLIVDQHSCIAFSRSCWAVANLIATLAHKYNRAPTKYNWATWEIRSTHPGMPSTCRLKGPRCPGSIQPQLWPAPTLAQHGWSQNLTTPNCYYIFAAKSRDLHIGIYTPTNAGTTFLIGLHVAESQQQENSDNHTTP